MKANFDPEERGYVSISVGEGIHLLTPSEVRKLIKELDDALTDSLLNLRDELERLCRQQCPILFTGLHTRVTSEGWNYQFWVSVIPAFDIGYPNEVIFETWDNQIAMKPKTANRVLQQVVNQWIEHVKITVNP